MRWKKLAATLLCLVGAFPSEAWAQQAQSSAPIPPDMLTVSPDGVDMRSGYYTPQGVDLSIGDPQAGGFNVVRSFSPEQFPINNKPFVTNWNYEIRNRPNASGGTLFSIQNNAVGVTFLTVGGTSYTDISLGASSGRTLTRYAAGSNYYFVFAEPGGRTITFLPSSNGAAPASQLKYANGLTYDFTYDLSNTRLVRVTSNAGYQLIYQYQTSTSTLVSKICALNLATTTPPVSAVCPVGVPSVSYTYDSSGKRVATVTDAAGATETTTTTFSGYGTAFAESFYHPGDTQPWLTNSYTTSGDTFGLRLSLTLQTFGDGRVVRNNFATVGHGEAPTTVILGKGWTVNSAATTRLDWGTLQVHSTFAPAVTPTPTKITDPLIRATSVTYDSSWEKIVDQTQPGGQKLTLFYNLKGDISQQKRDAYPVIPGVSLITQYGYDCSVALNCAKPATVTDPRNQVTDYSYDPVHGGMLTATLPAAVAGGVRPQTRYSWSQHYAWYRDSSGTLVSALVPIWLIDSSSQCQTLASCAGTSDEIKTVFTYGASGTANNLLLTQKTISAGDGSVSATTSWTYDANGDKLTQDGPLPGNVDTTHWRYDAERRVVGIIDPDPDGAGARVHRAVRNTYDAVGRLTKAEVGTVNGLSDPDWAAFAAAQWVDYDYDIMSRKIRETSRSGGTAYAVTQFSYDSFGRLLCTAVRMDPAQWASQPDACVPQTSGANGPDRITRNSYDLADELQQVEEGVGTGVAGNVASYTYTSNSKLATLKDGENNLTTYEYDGFDRLSKTRYPLDTKGANSSSTTDYEELLYDPNGNVTERRLRGYAANSSQKILYTYDNLNRLTVEDRPGAAYGETDFSFGYDLIGRTLSASQSSGMALGYSFDALGRLLTKTDSWYAPGGNLAYQYDAAGRRTRMTWSGDGLYVDYDYDYAGNMLAIRENGATSGIGVLASYSYDNLYRRTDVTFGNGTARHYAWDPVSRLEGLQLDIPGAGLLIGKYAGVGTAIAYNPASQIQQIARSNDAYAYNNQINGNRAYTLNGLNQVAQYVTTPLSGSPATTALGYDARGNLTSLGGASYTYTSDNMLASAPGVNFSYTPYGRMFEINSGSVVTTLQTDGDDLAAESNGGTAAILRRYIHGPGIDEPIVWYEGAGTSDRRFLQGDERGSIIAVMDSAGSVMRINSYDAYGAPAPGNLGRFQYTGQAWLPEIGMYDYKARIYSASLGRFLQTDPTGYDAGPNLYAYVGNDPVNYSDPTGLFCVRGAPAAFNKETGAYEPCATLPESPGVIGRGSRTRKQLPPTSPKPQKEEPTKFDLKECAGSMALGAIGGALNPVGLIMEGGAAIYDAQTRTASEDALLLPNERRASPRLQRGWGAAVRIGLGRAITSTPQMRIASAVTGAGLALLSDKSCGIGAIPSLPDLLPTGF